jgi:hypothetical protein
MRRLIIMLVSLNVWLLSACIDEIDLPIRTEDPRLVVEGVITNERAPYTVRLFTTGDFLSARQPPASLGVPDALVTISDELGNAATLHPVLAQPGVYRTRDTAFVGQIGRSYSLTVVMADGKMYRSQPELLRSVPEIDKLSAEFVRIADRSQPSGYRVYADTQDPPDEENYYRWSAYGYVRRESGGLRLLGGALCCNSCWIPVANTDVNIFSDANVNGNRIQNRFVLFSPFYVRGKQYVEVSQYSLSREAYQFWRRLDEQQTRTGSIFDPQPAPIEGNVYNAEDPAELALGYFAASAISRKRFIIAGDTVTMFPDYGSAFIRPGDCRFAYPFADFYQPENW